MKRKALRTLFRGKIEMELWWFKEDMKNQEPEEIIACAYEIDTKISIYELLLEMAEKFPDEVLVALISFQGLLDYVYSMWLKKEDSQRKELQCCINQYLLGMEQGEETPKQENDYGNIAEI